MPRKDKSKEAELVEIISAASTSGLNALATADGLAPAPMVKSSPELNVEAWTPPGRDWGKCTPEITKAMVETIIEGNDPSVAAVAAGISLHTFYSWKQRALAGESPYTEWLDALAKASAECEIALVRTIARGDDKGAGFGPAKAALELIGRRYPKRWSQQVTVVVADQLARFIDVAERTLPGDLFQKLLEGLADDGQEE